MAAFSMDMTDEDPHPYFLSGETTIREFRAQLACANEDEKARLLGVLMREARDPDVWLFTTVAEVRALFPKIDRYLGRRREFWHYLLDAWERHGLA
ncbi:MAG: hypothetical protein ACRELY_07565 [Polyangiaceae bacterium]